MSNLYKYLSSKDNKLVDKVISLVDIRKYDAAMDLIYQRLGEGIDIATQNGTMLKGELAGLLIDIGEEGLIEKATLNGLEILETNRNEFIKHMREYSLEYNLGNGKRTLFKFQRSIPNFKFTAEAVSLLIEAKNHYWKAYKLLSYNDKPLKAQIFVNLANTLLQSGRIAEALQYFDLVIIENPDFSTALANRSAALLRLTDISGSYTTNLLQQAWKGYDSAALDVDLPDWIAELFYRKGEWLKGKLEILGYNEDKINHDIEETEAESKTHSNFRKYCIENHLTLSEHALYCNCVGARRDDLTIPSPVKPIGGEFVPQMELILNRLKSEFAFARLLYYQSKPNNFINLETFDREITFTELYENEVVGNRSEMLRNSFRLCFGVLDKIAYGVCDLFDLAEPHEPLYFERFWKPRGKNLSIKKKERWAKINSIDNVPLLALYSQATDLNATDGEWSIFKKWRNALEHEILILTLNDKKPLDKYKILENQKDLDRVEYEEFEIKTLHMLRFTRSAIFNFVFCVRTEGAKVKCNGKVEPITFGYKKL